MNVRYRVELSQSERAELMQLMSGGKQAARQLKRAQILLAANAGVSDEDIAASVGVGGSTVYKRPNLPQRMVLRHPCLGRNVGKQPALVLKCPAHLIPQAIPDIILNHPVIANARGFSANC